MSAASAWAGRRQARWGQWSVDAPVGGGGLLQLDLTPVQAYVLNGSNGIVAQGKGARSAYYSDPRLAAQGTLEINGRSTRVSGQGWFDHQWGNFASNPSSMHWNWFACQFANRSDLMLYQFITPGGQPTGIQSASFVSPAGTVAHPQQFTVTPLAPMIRPAGATGTYPLGWHLVVPSAHVDVTLKARARNQFIANQFIPGFWEGAAAITSGRAGQLHRRVHSRTPLSRTRRGSASKQFGLANNARDDGPVTEARV